MLNILLKPGYLRAHLVIARLNLVKDIGLGIVIVAEFLDFSLDPPLPGHGCLQTILYRCGLPSGHGGFFVQAAQFQSDQLRAQLSFLRFQILVPLCGSRLPLQVLDMFLDLVDQVMQTFEVFPSAQNPALGFPPSFLVFRNARRFFEEHPQFLGASFDQPGYHALLDDGVTARPQPGAEENGRDVLSPAARVVEVIDRGAIARHDPANGDFGIVGVLPAHPAIGIVKNQFDRGITNRFASAGPVKDDIRHRIAAQVLGRTFPHHPAYRIDHIGLAAAIRPNNSSQISRKNDGDRVHERLKTRQLDFAESHMP